MQSSMTAPTLRPRALQDFSGTLTAGGMLATIGSVNCEVVRSVSRLETELFQKGFAPSFRQLFRSLYPRVFYPSNTPLLPGHCFTSRRDLGTFRIRLASSAQCADRTLEVLEWGLLQRDFAPSHRDSVLQTIVSGPLSEGILPEQYAHLLLFHGSRIYCPINQLLSQSLTSNPSSSWLRACINLCCCPFLSPCLIPLPHFPTPSYPSL